LRVLLYRSIAGLVSRAPAPRRFEDQEKRDAGPGRLARRISDTFR